MESFAKAPEPVSVEPMLRLRALGTQLTKSLLPFFSPYTSSIEKQDRRHRKTRHRKLIECATHINQDEHEMRIKRTLKTIRALDLRDHVKQCPKPRACVRRQPRASGYPT